MGSTTALFEPGQVQLQQERFERLEVVADVEGLARGARQFRMARDHFADEQGMGVEIYAAKKHEARF